jgi:transposase
LFLLRTGCQWRNIPHKYPPWRSVYWFWSKLQDYSCLDKVLNQTFEKLHDRDTKLYSKHILITDKGFESGKLQRELFQKLNLSFAPMKRKKKYKNSECAKELLEKEEIERKEFNTWIKSMRYAVEPVFSWFNKYRRLVRCFERTANSHTNFCKLAAIHLGLKRF